MTNAKNYPPSSLVPFLALVALSLFSLGWLWGYGLAESRKILLASSLHSTNAPISLPGLPSWSGETLTKRAVYERSNAIIGDSRHTN
jgi:hypothetical protein